MGPHLRRSHAPPGRSRRKTTRLQRSPRVLRKVRYAIVGRQGNRCRQEEASHPAQRPHRQKMTDKIVVLTTCDSEKQAEKLARHLVEQRVAACVNVLPKARSIYRWKEK